MANSNITTGGNSLPTLKGMAKRTYNRVITAMAEDTDAAMCHTFAALTDGAKAIALQAGHFSNTYIRGNAKYLDACAAAEELEAKASAKTERKLRKIDHICAVAFLAEYIARQRKADEPAPEPTSDNAPENMTAKEVNAILDKHRLNGDDRFRYMMLNRMQSDCDYYLYTGANQPNFLWAGDAALQIAIMRALWHSLPVTPEWLTLEQLNDYAKQLTA